MLVIPFLFMLSVNIYFATALQCFDCKLPDPSVDITELDLDQIQELFRSSTCNLGSYSADDERVSCAGVHVEAGGHVVFPPTDPNSPVATGPVEPEQARPSGSNELFVNNMMTHVSNFDIFGIKSDVSENRYCGHRRNHVECADADDSDRATICSCRSWPGCSGGRDNKSTFCFIFISFALSFLSY